MISKKLYKPEQPIDHPGEKARRGDLLQVFKILKGLDKVMAGENFLKLESQFKRGHSLKLMKPQHRTWKRSKFFSSRVVNAWNRLPEDVVSSKNVNIFKRRYDQYQTMTRRHPS